MCGISGIFSSQELEEADKALGRKILDALVHRGPDYKGEFESKNKKVFLGHNRLSIIFNNPEGNQPMEINENVISFNGEIYNYKYLANKYFSGIKNYGDTEILLRMWNKFGENSLKKIDVMYAFAIYDNDNLYLASDFFGEKSLYYYIKNNKLYFSSEIEPLIKLTNKELDEENFKIFLALGYLPDEETFYSQIKKLKPNTLMIVSRDLKIKFKKIYEIENYGDKKIIEQNDQKQFEELLIESIESRLTSDVELALMLSSGIDSSLIASIVSKELKKKIKTITLKNSLSDESIIASKISEHLDLDNFTIEKYTIDEAIFNSAVNSANDNIEIYAVNYISKFLKERSIKVALTGLGADEIFYGYNKYHVAKKYENVNVFKKIMYFFSSKLKKNYFKTNFDPHYYTTLQRSKKYLYLKNNLKLENLIDLDLDRFINDNFLNFIHSTRNFDLYQLLPNSFLQTNDIAGMKNSVEIRSPFLNLKLLNFINQFDPCCILERQKKFFLGTMLKKYLPEQLINKKKIGFNYSSTNLINSFNFSKLNVNLLKYYKNINQHKSNSSLNKVKIRLIMLNYLLNDDLVNG